MFLGEGGVGKSSSLGILALQWAQNKHQVVQKFKFTFLILLRDVNSNDSLADIILQQHGRLRSMNVTSHEIETILNKESDILFLMDGYDEYSDGTNEDIDTLLLHGRESCLVMVSSRPGSFLNEIKLFSDEEVQITGFSRKNVEKSAAQNLMDRRRCIKFLNQANNAGLEDLLRVPIILLMACAVFDEHNSLPSNRTKIFDKIVDMSISRTTLKTLGKTGRGVENLQVLKAKLGKLAWEALNKPTRKLLLSKVGTCIYSTDLGAMGKYQC